MRLFAALMLVQFTTSSVPAYAQLHTRSADRLVQAVQSGDPSAIESELGSFSFKGRPATPTDLIALLKSCTLKEYAGEGPDQHGVLNVVATWQCHGVPSPQTAGTTGGECFDVGYRIHRTRENEANLNRKTTVGESYELSNERCPKFRPPGPPRTAEDRDRILKAVGLKPATDPK